MGEEIQEDGGKASKLWRVKTPTVIQMEAVECGAASLSIILAYYGRWVPLEELRVECGVSRDGSNALNVLKAAQKYGLESKGMKLELKDLYELDAPSILFWQFNHYLVLEGFGKDEVFLNDPGTGPRTISYQELDQGYTGVVLLFKPTDNFQKGGKPLSLTKELINKLKSAQSTLGFLVLGGLCLLVPGLAVPAFTRLFIDYFFAANQISWPWQYLGGLFIAMLMAGILTFLQKYYLNRLNVKLSIRFSSEFVWHLLRLPTSFYMQRYSGEIAYRTTFNDQITQTMTGALASTCIDLMLLLLYGIVMFQYNAVIASIGVVAAVLNLTMMRFIQRSREDAYSRLQQDYGKAVGNSMGTLQQIEMVKAQGLESDAFEKFAGYYAKNINAHQEISKKDLFLSTCPVLLQSLTLASLFGFGGLEVMHGRLTIGMLMALQALLLSFLAPISRLVNFGQMIQNLKVDIARINDVLRNPVDPVYEPKERIEDDNSKLEGMVEFRNVSFGYSPLAPPLIENLSFTIKPGMRLALVGPSGCGKSTIARLASNLYRPWSGEILYDGKKHSEMSGSVMHRSLASVDQEIFLFAGSIKDNLSLWDSTVPDEIVFRATHDACIHEEILSRSNKGYEALLTEKGRNMSGGQRQRLEIARALLYSPSILIMDEATSALDSESEKLISDNIRKRGCTCIMIAHRLSTIQDCDEILVLDKGKVVQKGTHEELKEQEGLYQDLIGKESISHG